MVFSTQSTHKLLAGLSQALADPVQDSQTGNWDRHLQRGLPDAYLDLAPIRDHRVMRCGGGNDGAAGGRFLMVEGSIAEALDFRRAMRKVDVELGRTGGSRSGGR